MYLESLQRYRVWKMTVGEAHGLSRQVDVAGRTFFSPSTKFTISSKYGIAPKFT